MRKLIKMKKYSKVKNFINKFNLKSFNSASKVLKYSNFFNLHLLIKKFLRIKNDKSSKHLINVIKDYRKPHVHEMDDLCRLHWLVLKALNILEFGSGFSTLFIADACKILSTNFKSIKNIRVEKNFIYIL